MKLNVIIERMKDLSKESKNEDLTIERMNEITKELQDLTAKRDAIVNMNSATDNCRSIDIPSNNNNRENNDYLADDIYASNEYRQAFMKFVMRGEAVPVKFRQDANTTTSNITSVIVPTQITDRIITQLTQAGTIYSAVTRTNLAPGSVYKTSSFTATASWASEGTSTDNQQATTTEITFTGYKLRSTISISYESRIRSLSVFESFIVERITTSMLKALDTAIISGSGSGQPTGILASGNIAAARTTKPTLSQISDWETWTALVGTVPARYAARTTWVFNRTDWYTYIVGMVDSNGQPVARTNINVNGDLELRFVGRPVILVEDQGLTTYTSAAEDTVWAFLFAMPDYVLNENDQMTFSQYDDFDNENRIYKGLMLTDGKVIDSSSLAVVTKHA